MTVALSAVTFDATEPDRVAAFWASLLHRDVVRDARGLWLPGTTTQVGLRFSASETTKTGPGDIHLHLTSGSLEDQQETVAVALGLGATHLDVGQLPEETHVVLADPEGNELCVIGPHNRFLAGCGFLGEVACEGGREVGVFWSQALGWPLVWDQDDETAVQSPHGGTKVAWGGSAPEPRTSPGPGRRNRQRFELTLPTISDHPDHTDESRDLSAEVDRLVSLGATRLGDGDGGRDSAFVELADPEGNEFLVTRD